MPAIIPKETKDDVVNSWICGLSRRPNALKHGVSEGSVDNFVREWKDQRGPDGEYERVRALAVAISKSGLSIQECAEGHRVALIMRKMGVAGEEYESFISKLFRRYIASGLTPQNLAEQINQLDFFLENNQSRPGITTSLPQILESIKSKLDAISDLESKIQTLEKTKQEFNRQKEVMEAELGWDSQLKEKLNKNEFKKEDVPRFVDAALLMKERGYDIFDIMKQFTKFEEIADACLSVEIKKVNAGLRHDQLLRENQGLEVRISENSLKLHELDSLRALGFGLAEFRMLRDIITEVGEEIGLIGNDAVKNIFQDFQDSYYDYVRLRSKVAELKAEHAQLRAGANNMPGIFQEFLKFQIKSSESVPKNEKVTADDKSGEDAKNVNKGVPARETASANVHGSISEPSPAIEKSDAEHHLYTSHEKRANRENEDDFGEVVNATVYRDSEPDLTPELASQRKSKKMKIEIDPVKPVGQMSRPLIRRRPMHLPKRFKLKRSKLSDYVSSKHNSNSKSFPVSKVKRLPSITDLVQGSITEPIFRSTFGDRAEEIIRRMNSNEFSS